MTRAQYYHKIYVYKQRRKKYRKNYKGELPIYKTEQYNRLTKKIGQWQKEIKRLDVRNAKVEKIFKAVNSYFNVRIQDRHTGEKTNLARKIYFKIGLESGIVGVHLNRVIGRKNEAAAIGRTSLNKKLSTDKKVKETYINFKKHFERNG